MSCLRVVFCHELSQRSGHLMEDFIRSLTRSFVAPIGRFPAPHTQIRLPSPFVNQLWILWESYFSHNLIIKQYCAVMAPSQNESLSTSQTTTVLYHVRPKCTTQSVLNLIFSFLKTFLNQIFSPGELPTPAPLIYSDGTDPHASADYKVSNNFLLQIGQGTLLAAGCTLKNFSISFGKVFPKTLDIGEITKGLAFICD